MANASNGTSSSIAPEDIIKIVVATDIHLGYAEKHPIKADDSFVTFEEILKMGVDEGVYFVRFKGFPDSEILYLEMFNLVVWSYYEKFGI